MLTGRINAYRDEVLRDQPRAYWRMDDALGSTTIADSSGNGRNLTTVGTVLFQSDSPTGATGASSLLNDAGGSGISSYSISSSEFSLECWIRTNFSSQTQIIYSQRNSNASGNFYVGITNAGVVVLSWGGAADLLTTQTVNDGKWHHIVVTRNYNTDNMLIYIDNSISASGVRGGAPNLINFQVGYSDWTSPSRFVGSLSDIATYHKELTPQRVQAHYNARVTQFNPVNALTAEILADTPYAYLRGDTGIAGEIDAGVSGQGIVFPSSITGGNVGGALGRKQLLMNGADGAGVRFASNVLAGQNTWTVEGFFNPSSTAANINGSFSSGQRTFLGGNNSADVTKPAYNGNVDCYCVFSIGTNGVNILELNNNFGRIGLSYVGTISGLSHIVIRSVAKVYEIWVNGVLVAQAASASNVSNSYLSDKIGALASFGAYNGFLSNIALYNYALSPTRILAHKNAGGL